MPERKTELISIRVTPTFKRGLKLASEGEKRSQANFLEKLVLDTLGIEELRDYIGELHDEIARVEADIGRKNSHKSAADAFFRKPG